MGVIMKGGTSGNREDAIPSVPTKDGEYTYPKQAMSMPGTVNFDGATSGNREDALPSIVNVAFDRQEPQDTSKNVSYPNIQYTQTTGNRESDASPPVPNCATSDDSAA